MMTMMMMIVIMMMITKISMITRTSKSTDQDYVKNDNIGHEGLRPKLNVLMQRYKIQCCDLL